MHLELNILKFCRHTTSTIPLTVVFSLGIWRYSAPAVLNNYRTNLIISKLICSANIMHILKVFPTVAVSIFSFQIFFLSYSCTYSTHCDLYNYINNKHNMKLDMSAAVVNQRSKKLIRDPHNLLSECVERQNLKLEVKIYSCQCCLFPALSIYHSL